MLQFTHPILKTHRIISEGTESQKFNIAHHFKVKSETDTVLAEIDFQEGKIEEVGTNGITNEDLVLILICRLVQFYHSESSEEIKAALAYLFDAARALQARQKRMADTEVEDTSDSAESLDIER
jgi:hypothetical protein